MSVIKLGRLALRNAMYRKANLHLNNPLSAIRRPHRGQQLLACLFLLMLGAWWFYDAMSSPVTFRPTDLGLEHLAGAAGVVFLGTLLLHGFTLRSVVALVFPYIACFLLNLQLKRLAVTRPPELESVPYGEPFLIAIAELWIVFLWVFLFPVPDELRDAPMEVRRLAKRSERTMAAIVALTLLFQTGRLFLGVEASVVAAHILIMLRNIQGLVLIIYIFLVARFTLPVLLGYGLFHTHGSPTQNKPPRL